MTIRPAWLVAAWVLGVLWELAFFFRIGPALADGSDGWPFRAMSWLLGTVALSVPPALSGLTVYWLAKRSVDRRKEEGQE